MKPKLQTEFNRELDRLYQKRTDWLRHVLFRILGRDVEYQKLIDFETERCIVDFYDKKTGLWIDAKLHSYARTIDHSTEKYLKYTPRMMILYLRGRPRKSSDPRLEFVSVRSFYDELREKGGGKLIEKMNYLAKGMLTPQQKGELPRLIESYDEDTMAPQKN
jgi:hypothetical protein